MAEPLKNMFTPAFIADVQTALKAVHAPFDGDSFTQHVFDSEWENRELKDRVRHIANTLHIYLPDDYPQAVHILREAAQSPRFDKYDYQTMIFPEFVEAYGLDHWEQSIAAMEQFTQQSSAEFAVRPFIVQDQERMMAQMLEWAHHENHHVRRLASEGCRPRLPWAMSLPAFKKDPAPILPILEALKHDDSLYVRRSVANNLNDITKDNPQTVLDTLKAWQAHNTDEIRWITGHALRSLIKAGDTQALALLGYGEAEVDIQNFAVTPDEIAMGGEIAFSFDVTSKSEQSQSLMIDYVMHFVRANGKTNAKVFKLSKKDLQPNEILTLSKTHSFKPISTRKYYPGEHTIEIQVNGNIVAAHQFHLTP